MKRIQVEEQDLQVLTREKQGNNQTAYAKIDHVVAKIILDLQEQGDEALRSYTAQFDQVEINDIRVSEAEFTQAWNEVDPAFIEALIAAKKNIVQFHERQLEQSWLLDRGEGILLGQLVRPIEKIGVYVPGGKAVYPSTVLMDTIPAKVAGCKRIVMVTPPSKDGKVNPYTLAAAKLVGVDEVYKVGGAQAIAALAYGTETIQPVDKIVGPGNIYVARAKKMVFGAVDIDMIAGPSEVCIIADDGANPAYIAADLLAQAEHDEMAVTTLITTSTTIAEWVEQELAEQMVQLERVEIIKQSLQDHGRIYVVKDLASGFALMNEIAPEHLELMIQDPFQWIPKVHNAGAVFVGSYSPEPLGDYYAGPNHTLPTGGTARFSSPLGVYDFIKKSSVIYYNEQELAQAKEHIIRIAEQEGLTAHANAIRIRF
ncbi:histidinol dehydrogenase [Rubeoparvulum massiliense]|uniref:histidinol dehydrogenase n=1 Tax=Rubeoparvulum massiliense TaxID=1631346 RepID=UPI00069FBD92|nr:histidinol dehydrogenase [Rubeoparvulum massiliense]